MKNIVLIGFMGTGKTTVAEHLKELYGYDVVDMDLEIIKKQHLSIPEIFSKFGEEYFRKLETDLLVELRNRSNAVISCGGGAALRDENVIQMKKIGKVVLLTAKPETVLERVKNDDSRPLLKERKTLEAVLELMEIRRPKYEAAADVIIETDYKMPDEICREIINKI